MGNANSGRMLYAVTLSGASMFVNYDGGGSTEVALTDGTYYHSADAQADDLLQHVVDRLETVFGGTQWDVSIVGVNHSDNTKPQGSLRFVENSADFVFNVSSWTGGIDRYLGFPQGGGNYSSASQTMFSPHVHRGGSYLGPVSLTDELPARLRKLVLRENRLFGVPDAEQIAEWQYVLVEWQQVYSALVRADYTADASRCATAGIAQDDPNASLESWGGDVSAMANGGPFRIYPVRTAEGYYGPLYLPESSPLWEDSLALCSELRSFALYTAQWEGRTQAE